MNCYSIYGQLDKRQTGNSGAMEDGRNTEDVTVILLRMTLSRISDGKVMLHVVIPYFGRSTGKERTLQMWFPNDECRPIGSLYGLRVLLAKRAEHIV